MFSSRLYGLSPKELKVRGEAILEQLGFPLAKLYEPLEDQSRIKHVFLTHSHLDHTASLPIFLDNVYVAGPDCPKVYAHPATLESAAARGRSR